MIERRKKPAKAEEPEENETPPTHRMLEGARWHAPMTGDPSRCDQPGCTYKMTRYLEDG